MLLKVKNNQHLTAQGKSALTASGTAGQTVFNLRNTSNFNADLAIQIGEVGQEKSEVLLLSGDAASGKGTTTAGASFAHPVDTPVYCYRYDQVVFEVSTSGTAGTATAIASGTVTIQADAEYTTFDYTSASSTDAYKTKFYNSVLASFSPESDWIEYAGYSAYSLAGMRGRVQGKITADIEDDTIDDWLNEWNQEMVNAAHSINQDFGMGTVDLAFSGTAAEATVTSDDFTRPRRVWYTLDGVDFYEAEHIDYNGFTDQQTFSATQPKFYFRGDNVIGRLPHDSSGTLRVAYDALATTLDSDNDELPLPLRPFSKSYVDYALSQAYRHPSINNLGEAKAIENNAEAKKQEFIRQSDPRDRSTIEMIDMVEVVGGDII